MTAPLSATETLRLAKLQSYEILDTLPEAVYDDITALAANICHTPTALVSLIDSHRQWFKSKVGLEADETPRSMAFCDRTIQKNEVMIVEDAQLHPRFCSNPLVTGPPFIRFYAGAPLITPDGYALGSLCVLNYKPHKISPEQVQALQVLSHQVIAQMELSYQRHQLKLANQQLEQKVKERTASLTVSLHRLLKAQTTLLQREAASRHNALHDPLTQLPNRSYFLQRLNQAIQLNHRQPSHHYAVLFIDLDHFKPINDTLGHDIGDALLVHVAQQIQQLFRKSDLVARLGGDEFAVLLDSIRDENQAVTAIKRLQQRLKSPVAIEGHKLSVGVSIGVTFSRNGYRTPEAALKDADLAMYQAKNKSRERIRQQLNLQTKTQQHPSPILLQDELSADNPQFAIFDAEMRSDVKAKVTLEEELRQALIHNQFQLYYQPIFELVSQSVSGFELLLRWQHPVRGTIPATDFIETAEEIGIMQQLSDRIIQDACQQRVKWHEQDITLHINLSLTQIQNPSLVVHWQSALKKYNLPASAFQLEISEHLLISDDPTITKVLSELKEIGFQLCIDDFGRGHSSLSRLHQLSVDALKVDRTFVKGLNNQQGKEVAKTMVDFGHSASMTVIAEGVETPSQMQTLLALGCHQVQGFWLSHALPAGDIDKIAR